MANTILTLAEIENLFQSLTSTILNTTDQGAVRIGWPQDGAPAWPISYDVVFLLINYTDSEIAKQFERSYSALDTTSVIENISSTVPLRVGWTLYGPNSFDHASLIRSSLFLASSSDTLAASNVALVTAVAMPVRVPELFNGQWWERTTFYAEFNQLSVTQSTVPYLLTADVQTVEG